MKRKPVAEQIVVVMGASSRIGRATALAFARAGARLVVSVRGPRGLESLVAEIRGFGGHALSVVAETRVFSHVHEVAETAERELGGLDTWVQATEMPIREPFEKMTPAELSQTISLGVVGHAYAALAAIPIMKRHGGGQLIHVSPAPRAHEPCLHVAAAAANRGVAGLLDSLRFDLKRQGAPIGVTRVVPPASDPERVAAAIVRAALRPRREVRIGGSDTITVGLHRHFPRLAEAMLQLRSSLADRRRGRDGAGEPFADRTEREVPIFEA